MLHHLSVLPEGSAPQLNTTFKVWAHQCSAEYRSRITSLILLATWFPLVGVSLCLICILILRMLQMFEFSHRRTAISDFSAICCTGLKESNHFNIYQEYILCQGLSALYFRMKNSSFLYCRASHRKLQIVYSFCLKTCSVLNGHKVIRHFLR